MKYSLVLQWPASVILDYRSMIEIEDVLMEQLVGGSQVDGHDAGSGEMNIFIFTDDPVATFTAIQNILGSRDFWVEARVAYREAESSDYTILWPKGLTKFNVA